MADDIFDATLDVDNDVKVNNFDWSHANNLTTQIGRITPIFCDLVPAKTSFRVNPRFGLQFMPMVFPIQTRMKARISFFRYPLRALWKDYKDFIGNFREGLEEPYVNINTDAKLKKMASTGSLGDYLGLPTTLVGSYGQESKSIPFAYYGIAVPARTLASDSADYGQLSNIGVIDSADKLSLVMSLSDDLDPSGGYFPSISTVTGNGSTLVRPWLIASSENFTLPASFSANDYFLFSSADSLDDTGFNGFVYSPDRKQYYSCQSEYTVDGSIRFYIPTGIFSPGDRIQLCIVFNAYSTINYNIDSPSRWNLVPLDNPYLTGNVNNPGGNFSFGFIDGLPNNCSFDTASSVVEDVTLATSPWYSSASSKKDKQQKILAYGFRAYEGIYNSFFRDNRNNPYYLNGQVQYNTWIPNDAGGADDTLYELRYANWEKDFLTTAVQSPQQGNAPLVGITTYTQTVSNDDGTRTELVKTALVDEDGKKYGLSFKTSDEGLEGVEYLELDNGTAVRQARSLYDLATSGISIPDLRMVNCYQKFLELNMRKGYSYKDIVEGRFAVKVRYADLLLPEFFGGVSRDIDVNSVTQTVDQNAVSGSGDYATALGSQSGLAGVRGEANANIECFCDEESIIMGILVVTPLPVYTQLLPKHFTYRGLMDHYQPEFNLIGFQPIKYNEVCPIQAFNNNPDSLTETFGYNRPWYEYAQKYDVAHGLFRTSLSNFLMHRVFNQKPELAQSFLLVDPEQVTDVFAVTETTDKIYGQIWLDITCKLPIARVAIPRLD